MNTVEREPVDPNDPHIQEVATWAVNEHNKKTGSKLVYKKTIEAEKQVFCAAMTRYFIKLVASDAKAKEGNYFTKVVEVLAGQHVTRILEEFTPLKQLNAPVALPN